ncbi:MAG TPA: YtxH domain-containing protein [Phenylobacterium sp.]
MRSSFTATTGLKLSRSPSAREEALRRRAMVLGAVLGLAAIGAAIGLLTAPRDRGEAAESTSPFSYFPSE